jgi:hypothetical protein
VDPGVVAARRRLYANLSAAGEKAHETVLDAIAALMMKYYRAFRLEKSLGVIEEALGR